MIFIHALTGLTNRHMNERWQHSGSTISSIVEEVMNVMLHCGKFFMRQPGEADPPADRIRLGPKYFPFFDGCQGALDGTHIHAVVELLQAQKCRNRKKFISQNVLAVSDFNMLFTYALVGWEGSAHDGQMLADALSKGRVIFPGKYYLGDAGYALTRYFLTPFRGVRYHLKEWVRGLQRPQNKEELYNLRHSSLRNVIERIFGVAKKRFPLLVTMHSYAFCDQCNLVKCIFPSQFHSSQLNL